MGETVNQTVNYAAGKFDLKAHISLGAVAALGAIGLLGIAATIDQIDGSLAVFIASVGACVCAVNMITNWGASHGHGDLARLAGDLARLAAEGHADLDESIGKRLKLIEEIERETGNAVVIALDDLRARRQRNHG